MRCAPGVQVRRNDPAPLVPAMAHAPQHPGFCIIISTPYEPPFALARRFSTLDHLTEGRFDWNIVTSAQDCAFSLRSGFGHGNRSSISRTSRHSAGQRTGVRFGQSRRGSLPSTVAHSCGLGGGHERHRLGRTPDVAVACRSMIAVWQRRVSQAPSAVTVPISSRSWISCGASQRISASSQTSHDPHARSEAVQLDQFVLRQRTGSCLLIAAV